MGFLTIFSPKPGYPPGKRRFWQKSLAKHGGFFVFLLKVMDFDPPPGFGGGYPPLRFFLDGRMGGSHLAVTGGMMIDNLSLAVLSSLDFLVNVVCFSGEGYLDILQLHYGYE